MLKSFSSISINLITVLKIFAFALSIFNNLLLVTLCVAINFINNIPNIVCVQPFACLPNHVVGKGVIKSIREKYPYANISPIDYDPGVNFCIQRKGKPIKLI